MSKSIKFKNNTYLDSRSIMHGRTELKTKLDNIDANLNTKVNGLNYAWNKEIEFDIASPQQALMLVNQQKLIIIFKRWFFTNIWI